MKPCSSITQSKISKRNWWCIVLCAIIRTQEMYLNQLSSCFQFNLWWKCVPLIKADWVLLFGWNYAFAVKSSSSYFIVKFLHRIRFRNLFYCFLWVGELYFNRTLSISKFVKHCNYINVTNIGILLACCKNVAGNSCKSIQKYLYQLWNSRTCIEVSFKFLYHELHVTLTSRPS